MVGEMAEVAGMVVVEAAGEAGEVVLMAVTVGVREEALLVNQKKGRVDSQPLNGQNVNDQEERE